MDADDHLTPLAAASMRLIPTTHRTCGLALVLGLSAGCAADTAQSADSTAMAQPRGVVDSAAGSMVAPAADTTPDRSLPTATGPHAARLAEWRNPANSPVLRGLYVNRFAAHSSRRMKWLLDVADSTEINALVIEKNG